MFCRQQPNRRLSVFASMTFADNNRVLWTKRGILNVFAHIEKFGPASFNVHLGDAGFSPKTRRVRRIFAKLSAIVCGEGRIGVKECGCFIPNWMGRNVVRPHVLAISDLPLSGVLSLSLGDAQYERQERLTDGST